MLRKSPPICLHPHAHKSPLLIRSYCCLIQLLIFLSDKPTALNQIPLPLFSGSAVQMGFSLARNKQRTEKCISILFSIKRHAGLLMTAMCFIHQPSTTSPFTRVQPTWYSDEELQPFIFLGGCCESCTFLTVRDKPTDSPQFFPSSEVCLTSAPSAELRDNCRCLLGSQLFLS